MKASETRKVSRSARKARNKAEFKRVNSIRNEKATLARKDFPVVSRDIRKKIREYAKTGWTYLDYEVSDREGCKGYYGNFYLEALCSLISEKFEKDGYSIERVDVLNNGTKYEHPTRYWALLEVNWGQDE